MVGAKRLFLQFCVEILPDEALIEDTRSRQVWFCSLATYPPRTRTLPGSTRVKRRAACFG